MRLGIFWFFVMIIAEIWSIVQVGNRVGALATLVLLAAGFIFGLQLMRSQGLRTLMHSARNVKQGESPLAPIAVGVVRAFAGILLMVPGFVSDILALIILMPFVRTGFAGYLAKKGKFQGFATGSAGGAGFGDIFGKKEAPGHVYDHNGPVTRVDDAPSSGRVIEHEPEKKD